MERYLRKLNVKILISLIVLLILKINTCFTFDNTQCLSPGTHVERKVYRFRPGFESQLGQLLIVQPWPLI